jgi:hypothetical protein
MGAVVDLRIEHPAHGEAWTGGADLALRAAVDSTGHPPLFFSWYSSLVGPPAGSTDAALAPAGPDPLDAVLTGGLPLGSQVLTLSARDVVGTTAADLAAVRHAGIAGGPAIDGNPRPCVVHILIADMVEPVAGATLSRASTTLVARAPRRWPETEYQQLNRLAYRWRFEPTGPPAGRPGTELRPRANELTFADAAGPEVRLVTALPQLAPGAYRLTLRVEDSAAPALGDEVKRDVVVTA